MTPTPLILSLSEAQREEVVAFIKLWNPYADDGHGLEAKARDEKIQKAYIGATLEALVEDISSATLLPSGVNAPLRGLASDNIGRRGGKPTIKGTGFTLAQFIIEMIDDAFNGVCENFSIDREAAKDALHDLASWLQQDMSALAVVNAPWNIDDLPNGDGLKMLVAGKNSLFSCSEDPQLEDARKCWQAMWAVFSFANAHAGDVGLIAELRETAARFRNHGVFTGIAMLLERAATAFSRPPAVGVDEMRRALVHARLEMQTFIDKVDRVEARSVRSYTGFKNEIARIDEALSHSQSQEAKL